MSLSEESCQLGVWCGNLRGGGLGPIWAVAPPPQKKKAKIFYAKKNNVMEISLIFYVQKLRYEQYSVMIN